MPHWGDASHAHWWEADPVAAVTHEEMRELLADQDRRLRELLADQDRRMGRLIKAEVQPLKDQAQRIEVKVDKTNGRVTHLEGWRIENDARADERAKAAMEAAELVARKAAEALSARERSRRWWFAAISAWGVTVATLSTLANLLTQHLH